MPTKISFYMIVRSSFCIILLFLETIMLLFKTNQLMTFLKWYENHNKIFHNSIPIFLLILLYIFILYSFIYNVFILYFNKLSYYFLSIYIFYTVLIFILLYIYLNNKILTPLIIIINNIISIIITCNYNFHILLINKYL